MTYHEMAFRWAHLVNIRDFHKDRKLTGEEMKEIENLTEAMDYILEKNNNG